MASLVALVREPSASLAQCELTYVGREPIDISVARAQHTAYCEALRAAGAEVVVLPALDALPDAAFVEDTAVVVDEVAVLGALGVASRVAEGDAIVSALEKYRPVRRLTAPGATLEGGDVLQVGRTLYVGRSRRTNDAGIESLRRLLEPLDYAIRALPLEDCLHLKTACTCVGDGIVLLNPAWLDRHPFERDGLGVLPVDPSEPWAANALRVRETLLVASGNPRTVGRLRRAGLQPVQVAIGEFQKAEAGLSCLSVLVAGV
jgi:dimethylargininase